MENPIVQNNPHIQQAHDLLNNINAEGLASNESNQTQPEQPQQVPAKVEQDDTAATQEESQHGLQLNKEYINKVKEPEDDEDENKSPSTKCKERSPKLKNLKVDTQLASQVASGVVKKEEQENPNPNADAPLSEADMAGTTKCNSNIGVPTAAENYPADKDQKVIGLKRVNSVNHLESPTKKPAEENKQEQPASANQRQKISINDFTKITGLGKGSYAEVFLVRKNANNKLYALKALDKNFMLKEKKQYQAHVEKEVLLKMNHPNIIKIYSSFQDDLKLYFVLEYVSGGEFADYLRVQGKLPKQQVVFFAAEVINILEYIHNFGIAHRDMKPENILLTQDGHLKCIDFGTAKFLASDKRTAEIYAARSGKAGETTEMSMSTSNNSKRNHRSTFVGTPQYVSPEMLEGSDCGAPADLWSLGCMLYLMATGKFPFADTNEYLIFQKIKNVVLKFPEDIDPEIKDLVQKLLVKDPNMRLGAGIKGSENGYDILKAHPLFKGVDFATIHEQNAPVVEIASPHKRKSHDSNPELMSPALQPNRKHYNSDDLTQAEQKPIDLVSEKSVRVILSGLVLKKCGWLFYKPRQLILNSKPKLVYYDPDTNQLKGEVLLTPTTKAELESKTKFVITAPNKKYYFKEMEHSAEKWVELVNNTISQLYKKN